MNTCLQSSCFLLNHFQRCRLATSPALPVLVSSLCTFSLHMISSPQAFFPLAIPFLHVVCYIVQTEKRCQTTSTEKYHTNSNGSIKHNNKEKWQQIYLFQWILTTKPKYEYFFPSLGNSGTKLSLSLFRLKGTIATGQ